MTTQDELDDDFKTILNAHLITRRDLLKKVKAELWAVSYDSNVKPGTRRVLWSDVEAVMNRLIEEAKLPDGN